MSASPDDGAARRARVALLGGLAVFGLALAYARAADLYLHLADDGGITLRYAERVAAGRGFGYDDGEATNGCSNPLYALALALLLHMGLAPAAAVHALGGLGFAGAAALVFGALARAWSLGAALVAVVSLASFSRVFDPLFDGMESPFVLLFGALFLRALHGKSELARGLALGLLVANKLDGGLAALAYALVHAASRRRFPLRAAAAALLVCLPLWAWQLHAFGSLVPNSLVQKLGWHAELWDMDPLWMHRLLAKGPFAVVYFAALGSLAWWLVASARRATPLVVIQLWLVLHLAAFAVLDLGGPFPWYATTPKLLAVVLAAFVVHVAGRARRVRGLRFTLEGGARPVRTALAVAAALVFVLTNREADALARLRAPSVPYAAPPSACSDLARQAAGAWLRAHTSASEQVVSPNGLPAYEYGGPYYDLSLLNNRRDEARRRSAEYEIAGPRPAAAPLVLRAGDRLLVATFVLDAASERYEVFALPTSELVTSGVRHIVAPRAEVWCAAQGSEPHRLDWRDGALAVPLGERARFDVDLPGPIGVLFTATLERADGALLASGSARLALSVDRETVFEGVVAAGGGPLRVVAHAPRPGERRRATLVLRAEPAAAGLVVRVRELLVRTGEPPRPEDFKLLRGRSLARVRHVAEVGLPYAAFAR